MSASFLLLGHLLLVGSLGSAALDIQQNQSNGESNDVDPIQVSHQPVFQVTDLKVTYLDSTQAEIKWLKPAGLVSGYLVRICALDTMECQHELQNEAYLYLHQLKPNNTYQVWVTPFRHTRPRSQNGLEAEISFTTLQPPRLDDVDVRPLNSTTVAVKWKGVPGASIIIHVCPVPLSDRKCHIYHMRSDRSAFLIDDLEPGTSYTFVATFSTIAGGHTHPGTYVSRKFKTPPLAPSLDDFEVRPLNSSSLEVAWKPVPGVWILIKVCPAESNEERCSNHGTSSERSQFIVDNLQPETLYIVSATFSPTEDGLIDPSMYLSKNITTYAQAPSLDDFEVRPLNSDSLNVAWKSVSGAWILIKVCPAQSNEEMCVNHSVSSERAQFIIGDLEPATIYTVSAVLRPTKDDDLFDPGMYRSKNITTNAQAPKLDEFDIRILNSTSLEVAWNSVSGAWFLIKICPARSSVETCSNHSVSSERAQFEINDLKPGTVYTVSAMFSATADGLIDSGLHTSKIITTPAHGDGNSAASLPLLSGLVMLLSLFCLITK